MENEPPYSERPICLRCNHWETTILLRDGAFLRTFGCAKRLPAAGRRRECSQFLEEPDMEEAETG